MKWLTVLLAFLVVSAPAMASPAAAPTRAQAVAAIRADAHAKWPRVFSVEVRRCSQRGHAQRCAVELMQERPRPSQPKDWDLYEGVAWVRLRGGHYHARFR